MKKIILTLCLLLALPICAVQTLKAAETYDAAAALENAKNDVANWMKYLPDNVFVAHVSIPGTHDAATAEGWETANGPTYSTTQAKTIDEQLIGGIRAFDFRPGMNNGVLYCNHGTDRTKLTLEQAFTKLTDYLDAHPSEFYVIHLFRGNVYAEGTKPDLSGFLGAKDDAASIAQYNELFNQFFNQGKFNDYIIDYSPNLKIKDIRGKMVIFRRDRISFAHVAKAGNLNSWPGDTEKWTENSIVGITHASDNTIKGSLRATDISSPDDDSQLEIELNSMTDLFNYNCNLPTPNELKQADIAYKPDWTMIFTSGALYEEKTKGYLENATHTNPHFTSLIKNACAAGKTGPTGTVFSDWVMTDSHTYSSKTYATMGVELIPTIIENNFHYIENYILDEDLFKASDAEMFWDESKEYYMRNIETGLFLAGGQWWGTHAIVSKYGIRVKPHFDINSGTYTLGTNIGTDGGYGPNDYIDNGDTHLNVVATRVSPGKYTFTTTDGTKAITVIPTSGWLDGTEYSVQQDTYTEGNTYQQWELIPVDEYFNEVIADASMSHGVDISFNIGRWMQNGPDNSTWATTTGNRASGGLQGQTGDTNNKLMLYFNNAKQAWNQMINWNASWSVSKDITGIPNGVYTLSWDAVNDKVTNLTMTVNNTNVTSLIKSEDAGGATTHIEAANKFLTGNYNCTSPQFIVTDNTVRIRINNSGHTSATAAAFDNFRLTYYGPDPTVTCERIRKAIDDATAKVNALPAECQEGWSEDMAPFQAIVDSKDVTGDGTSQVNDIYTLLRQRVYMNLTEGADFTSAIINNSFETGDLFGWEISPSSDTNVYPNSNGTYTTDNCDGDYLFNTWPKGTPIYQTLPSLPAGHYKLQAFAVTGDTSDPRYVYIFANDHHSDALGVNIDKVTFSDVEWEFDVAETGNVIIGMLGAKADGTYDEFGDYWYKADNFRLTYMGEPVMDVFYDFLQKAIDMATARVNTLPEQYRAGWDAEMAPYLALIENRLLEGDGTKEADEIYSLMRAHVFAQTEPGANFTAAITNNSFEWGTAYGWTVAEGRGDTGVKPNSDSTYSIDNCDGDYLYNTWDGDNWGAAITQTIPNVPAGNYRLTALLTSDAGKTVYLTANDSRVAVTAAAKTHGEEAVLEFTLTETGDLTIGASSLNTWYKADNFRLTFISTLEQTIAWTIQGSAFDTLILPFEAEIPAGLEVYTADDLEMGPTGRYHVLVLSPATAIEACKPYVVKRADAAPAALRAAARETQSYEFIGIPQNVDSDLHTHGVLTGTLSGTTVAAGGYAPTHETGLSYFMTDIDGTTAIEANHAYIANDDNKASLSKIYFETPADDLNTGVDNVIADDAPVSVYSTAGVLLRRDVPATEALDGLAAGVYIITDGFNITKTVK